MANYLYFESDPENLYTRYTREEMQAEELNGLDSWKRYIELLFAYLNTDSAENRNRLVEEVLAELRAMNNTDGKIFPGNLDINFNEYTRSRSGEEWIAILLLNKIRTLAVLPNRCPRLFISHRQADYIYALRMAQIANAEGFEYWVDVLDPALAGLTRLSASHHRLRSLLTACIIEMALINCTHVIACLTPKSRGSLWQPYEYGRITEVPGYFKKAAAWLHPNLDQIDYPEYMLLGENFSCRKELSHWLRNEYLLWASSSCQGSISRLDNILFPELPEIADPQYQIVRFPYNMYLQFNSKKQIHSIANQDQEIHFLKALLSLSASVSRQSLVETGPA
jgi:hypothetical protein